MSTIRTCIVLTLAAFVLMWPLLSFRLAFGSGGMRRPNIRRVGRHVAGYMVTRQAVENGVEDADRDGRDRATPEEAPPSRPIPDDRPRTASSAPTMDEESTRIYRSLGLAESPGVPKPARVEGMDDRAPHPVQPHPGRDRVDDRVLVGTVVSPAPSEQENEGGGERRFVAQRPQPVQIYDPVAKRHETFRETDGGGDR